MGLDTFICMGRGISTETYEEEEIFRVWVLTTSSCDSVVFWDPMTGASYTARPKSINFNQRCPFRTVDCVFNHNLYLANIQPDSRISDVSFDFGDTDKWKPLNLQTCPKSDQKAPISPVPWSNRNFGNDFCAMANWLESEFKRLFAEHRHNIGYPRAEWDEKLCSSLGIALSGYEMASCFSQNFVMPKDFLNATKTIIPAGCILRAVPLQVCFSISSFPFL